MSELMPDHIALVTIAEASERIGKPEGTIGRWVSDGLIPRRGFRGRELLVAYSDVVEAEFQTRTAPRGRRPKEQTDGT